MRRRAQPTRGRANAQGYIDRSNDASTAAASAATAKDALTRRIEELDQLLGESYGPDGAYYALKGQCFTHATSEYRFELCPFASVTQRGVDNSGGTDMGRWSKASWVNDRQWQFSDGLGCWQGPQRSTLVTLSCGADSALSHVRGACARSRAARFARADRFRSRLSAAGRVRRCNRTEQVRLHDAV